ncbi:MAG: hypothetical protein KDA83_08155, partial [Planctomycetales bacterium]|nr:hypothetical protein [Planctomycetales bacterium]
MTQSSAQDFERDVLPIFRANCLACHNASERQGDLVLETPATILSGGDTGPGVVPGQPEASLLWQLAAHREEPVMPPEDNDVGARRLNDAELAVLAGWIRAGATGNVSAATSPQRWSPLPPGVHPVQAITMTNDGQFAAASRANRIEIIHVPTGQVLTRLSDPALDEGDLTGIAHRDLIHSLTFNRSGDRLASGGYREAKVWQRPRDVQLWNLALGQAIERLAVSPDRSRIAVALADGSLQVVDAAGQRISTPAWSFGTPEVATALAFSPDGNKVVSAHASGAVHLWDAASGTWLDVLQTASGVTAATWVPWESNALGQAATEESAAIAPDESLAAWRLVTGGADNRIRVWQWPPASDAGETTVAEGQAPAIMPAPNTRQWTALGSGWSAWIDTENRLQLTRNE